MGPPIGLGGFGELYLAAERLPDGSISSQHFVIKVRIKVPGGRINPKQGEIRYLHRINGCDR